MIDIYGKTGCSNCDLAKSYFDERELKYTYHDLSEKENRSDRKFYRDNGWKTLPIIIINEYTVEGFDEDILGEIICATKIANAKIAKKNY